jgi:hypothetical protein
MADDQIGPLGVRRGERVIGGGGQRHQNALLAEIFINRGHPGAGQVTRDAEPPNRPRTSPKQLAPGTKTQSPSLRPD